MYPNIPGYRISKKIGEGGTSTVYSAIQENPNRPVALKIMDPDLLEDPANLRRFSKQVNIAKKLKHNNIVKTYCLEQYGQYHYIVMELLGESLKDRLNRHRYFNVDEALAIVQPIAHALAYAHSQGVVHWDIKPGNILFRSNNHPVIVDFGLAFCRDLKVSLTTQGVPMGSLPYMSPEHCMGKKGESTGDIFSLGVVLFELLTGKPPYNPGDLIDLANMHSQHAMKRLPQQLKRYQPIIDKMMAFDKKKRIQDGEKVIRMIDRLNGRHCSTELTSWEKLKDLKIGGVPTLVAASAAALIIVLGLMIFNVIGTVEKKDKSTATRIEQYPHKKSNSISPSKSSPPPGKIFDPTAKKDTTATRSSTSNDVSREEQKSTEPQNSEPNVQPATKQTSPPTQIPVNNGAQGSNATTPSLQPTAPKLIEIPTVTLSQLDPDIRANIEAKFRQINVPIDGVERVIKTGNYKVIIAFDSSGLVKVENIPGIIIEPQEKSTEFKKILEQTFRSMNFPSPIINGKKVNVKINLSFKDVRSVSKKVILENN